MLKTLWRDIQSEEVRYQIIAGAILFFAGGFASKIGALILHGGWPPSLPSAVRTVVNFQIPLWLACTCFFLISIISISLSSKKMATFQRTGAYSRGTFFDSSRADRSWFTGFGNTDWKDGKAYGELGFGRLEFKSKIITVTRQNTAGKFEIIPSNYAYGGIIDVAIAHNPGGETHRTINIKFKCRSISGKHRVIVILKRPNWSWIDQFEFTFSHEGWKKVDMPLCATSIEDFDIEFQIFSPEAGSAYQIKDLIIKEISSYA